MSEYFKHRRVSSEQYKNVKIPDWIKAEISGYDKLANILDFGCGFGQVIDSLKKDGFVNVYGVDIETNAINENLNKGNCVKENINEFNSIKFDVIICNHVLEHLPKRQVISTIKSMMNILSKDGILLVSVPNAQANTGCYWAYEDFTHQTLFTTGSLFYVFSKAGCTELEYIDIKGTNFIKNPIKKYVKYFFLMLYHCNRVFWNKVTSSYYHSPSECCYSYEIKAKVRVNNNEVDS